MAIEIAIRNPRSAACTLNFSGTSTLLGKKICLKECRQSANVERRAAISLIALCLASYDATGQLGQAVIRGLRWASSPRLVVFCQGLAIITKSASADSPHA